MAQESIHEIHIRGKESPYIEDAFWVRDRVFSVEQGFDPNIDVDEYDDEAIHVVIYDEHSPIATGRLILFPEIKSVKIGRVAVLASYRKKGIGIKLMSALINAAQKEGMKSIKLSSQTHAIPFYEKMGFKAEGNVYLEEGEPHQAMVYQLRD